MPQSEAVVVKLLAGADQISRARILAKAKRESGRWLQALPTPTLGTLLDTETFRVAIDLRVGSDVCIPHVLLLSIDGCQKNSWSFLKL